jgi:ParB-like chromosome segregation protein Spo0J
VSLAIRDRIKELRRVKASELAPNPLNWRTHPKEQADALRGLLAEVGIAGAVLAREQADGTLQLIDGHLRAQTLGDKEIPVLILDVDQDEAAKILETYDPLGAMAGSDAETLKQLLTDVSFDNDSVNKMIDSIIGDDNLEEAPTDSNSPEDVIPEQYQVLVICNNEHEQSQLLQELSSKGLNCRSLIRENQNSSRG